MVSELFTVQSSGKYSSSDGQERRFFAAGTVLPLSVAVRFGLSGAATQQAQRDAEVTGRAMLSRSDLAKVPSVRGNTYVALGDSITAANSGATTDAGGRSYATLLPILADGRLRKLRNAGLSGDTASGMLARLKSDVLAYAPDYCFVLGGTNDVTTDQPAAILPRLVAIWETLRANNIVPIAGTIPPKDTTKPEVAKLNAMIRHETAKRGIPLIDYYTLLVDPADGTYKAAYDNGDGTHPNDAGALAMAQLAKDTILTLLPPGGGPVLTNHAGDNASLITNGLFTGDANSDGVADSWGIAGSGASVTPSLVAGSGDVLGNWQVLTQTAGGQRYIYQNIATGFAAGDTLELSGRVQSVDIASGAMQCFIRLEYNATGSIIAYVVYQLLVDLTGIFRCRGVVPAGATQVRPMVMTGATGTGTLQVAQLTLTNLTALGLV